jgi:pantoate--beta-alanine ligase
MQVITTRKALAELPTEQTRGVVMTMGALHAGHQSLMAAARREVGDSGLVVVTIFVNPLQFGANEDFDQYPRTVDADLDACREAGVDVVFMPEQGEIYPTAVAVTVEPGPLGEILEGAERPGHFRGVLTVVSKILHLTRADTAVFGEKDYQQLTLISQMARDLFMPVRIVPVRTVREFDGLAMSSRNRYLSDEQRTIAACIPRALEQALLAAPMGAEALMAAGLAELTDVDVDYFTVTSPDLGPVVSGEPGRVLVAIRIGDVRLIDNAGVPLVGSR